VELGDWRCIMAEQPLLTPSSAALSLSGHRAPPHGSVMRMLYAHPPAIAVRRRPFIDDCEGEDEDVNYIMLRRMLSLYANGNKSTTASVSSMRRHPHLTDHPSLADRMTRYLGATIPLRMQHHFRDSGYFGYTADMLATLSCPSLAVIHPKEARDFVQLSHAVVDNRPSERTDERRGGKRKRRWTRRRIPYGGDRAHSMQYIDLYLPSSIDKTSGVDVDDYDYDDDGKIAIRGTLFFVHGGAWGSGRPWMYRLVAPAFLRLNFAVVIVGYRTYPVATTINEQVGDVMMAWEKCGNVLNEFCTFPPESSSRGNDDDANDDTSWVGNIIMGHSSGAHVAMNMLVDWIDIHRLQQDLVAETTSSSNKLWKPDFFVGLSGPYNISHHFDYEAGRGVEEISPMKAICGHTRMNFQLSNPTYRFASLLRGRSEDVVNMAIIQRLTPPILLVHGIEDATVPFTATSDAGRILRSFGLTRCDEIYLAETGHADVIKHFMFGGEARKLVLDWIIDGLRLDTFGQVPGLSASQIRSRL